MSFATLSPFAFHEPDNIPKNLADPPQDEKTGVPNEVAQAQVRFLYGPANKSAG